MNEMRELKDAELEAVGGAGFWGALAAIGAGIIVGAAAGPGGVIIGELAGGILAGCI